jgi:uncharacterized protein YdgA (DUF945 family)
VFSAAAALIVSAILGFALLSDAAARAARKGYERQLRTLARSGLDIHERRYERGWFTSTAETQVRIAGTSVRVIQHIHHSPLMMFGGQVQNRIPIAVIDTDILREPDIGSGHGKADASPRIRTIVGFDGALYTHLSEPSFTYRDNDGTELGMQGLYADSYIRGPARYSVARMLSCSVTDANTRAEVRNMRVWGSAYIDPAGILLGTVQMTVDRFAMQGSPSAGERRFQMYLHKFKFSASDSMSKDLLEANGGISTAESNLGSGKISWQLSSVDVKSLQKLVNAAAPSPNDSLPYRSDAATDVAGLIYKIASTSPRLSIRLRLSSDAGKTEGMVDLAVADEFACDAGSTFGGSRLATKFDPSAIQLVLARDTIGSGKLTIPASVVRQILGQEELEALVMNGNVTQSDQSISTNIDLRNAQLTFNGRPLF